MALPDFTGTITIRDSEGKLFPITLYSSAASHALAVIAVQNVAATLNGILSQGVIASIDVSQNVLTDGTVPAGNVDGEIKALFTFNNTDGKAMQISIPAFQRSYLNVGSDTVNVATGDVQDFIDAMVSGAIVDSRDVDLVSLRSALEHFTRRRRS